MFKLLTPVLFSALALTGTLCDAAEQSRQVEPFKSITSRGAFDLTVDVGPAQAITLSGEEKYLDRVKTEVVDGELILSYREKSHSHSMEVIKITITVPSLSKMRLAGAGATELKHVKGDQFEMVSEGAGALKAEGKVKNLVLVAKGVGVVNAKGLHSQNADVSLNGVGAVDVYASQKLNASVNGIGALTYYGNPAQLAKSVNGLGHVGSGDDAR